VPITNVGFPIPVVGPGLQMIVATSLVGPLPTDWMWHVTIGRVGDENAGCVFVTAFVPWSISDHWYGSN